MGTIKRGELFPYTLPNDSNGYKMSATVMNPITDMTEAEMKEAGVLVFAGGLEEEIEKEV